MPAREVWVKKELPLPRMRTLAFYNLSKTPFSEYNTGIGLTYTPWLKDLGLNDVYLLAATGYHKLDDNQALTASIRYFSLGSIQFSDPSRRTIGAKEDPGNMLLTWGIPENFLTNSGSD